MTASAEIPIVVPSAADFAAFYRQNYANVARALGVTLGDWDLGSEAADEAMARCYMHWPTIHNYDNPAGWVYRVGLNWARSVHRRLRRKYPLVERPVVELPPVADPQVHRAIERLDLHLRAVIICRFLLDLSTRDTAEALGIRPGTVKSRVNRALAKLQVMLADLRQE
jgi:RNA polymerase sigma-70 factor (ECF subfamily)